MQKHLVQLAKSVQRQPQANAFQEPAVAGNVSITSSTGGETLPFYTDENLNRLAAVVGNASEEDQHDPKSRHTSPDWKHNMITHAKSLQLSDNHHVNTYSCITLLLLHFYTHIRDTNDRDDVDETIELVLDCFSDIQTRLQYPSDITVKVVVCVRTVKHMRNTDLGSIHGIPSVVPNSLI